MSFIPGYANPIAFQIVSGTPVYYRITGWNATDEVQRLITTYASIANTAGWASPGYQAAVAGIRDWTANVTANLYSTAMPWWQVSPITPGVHGLMYFYVTSARYFTVGVMVNKTNPASAVAGLVSFNFDVGMSADMTGFVFTPPQPVS